MSSLADAPISEPGTGIGDHATTPQDAERSRERREAADYHAYRLAHARAEEASAAQAQLHAFVKEAVRRGMTPRPLRVSSRAGGSRRFRTLVAGWYLRRDESVAVGADGRFYVLTADVPVLTRWLPWRPVALAPTEPRLVLGAGGRDGESIDLAVALRRILDQQPAARD